MSSTSAMGDGLPAMHNTRSPILAVLQRIGRSLMMPIAVLPAAAILERLGQDDLLGKKGLAQAGGFHWLTKVAPVINGAGTTLFDHLPLLFAIGVAIGFARRSDGSTALAALVGYLVFDRVTMTMFGGSRIKDQVMTAYQPSPTDPHKYVPMLNLSAPNPTGVLGGIVIGITAALLWQRFRRVKLPTWLAFFGGRRFVPIITAVAALILGVIFGWVWAPIGDGLHSMGNWLAGHGTEGAGIYGAFNRLLIPFGLHHIINSIVWFTVPTCHVAGKAAAGDLNCYFAGQQGSGTFMAGFFPVMMFGLPAAALAMWRSARPERRAAIGGIMISAALTSFITGVTEPIEFAFIFVAPLLFVVDIVLTGVSMALVSALHIKIGFGFSAGLIDYLINFSKANTHHPLLLLLIGIITFFVWYGIFYGLIKALRLPTPGNEREEEVEGETAAADLPSSG